MSQGNTRLTTNWIALICFVILFCPNIWAYKETISTDGSTKCWGMHGPSSIPGAHKNGSIKLLPSPSVSQPLSLLIYNYYDEHLISSFCDSLAISNGRCDKKDEGKWVLDGGERKGNVLNMVFNTTGTSEKVIYEVAETGFYCVTAMSADERDIDALVEGPYGLLPASEYPKLLFYGFLSITYLIIGVGWMILSFTHWRDLLPVQHYVSGVTIFLTLEMAFNYGFFEDYNKWGRPSTVLLIMCTILNAARNTISFFMLLIVSLGYGVVKPTLGTTMKRVLYLTYAHFICGVIYAASSLLVYEVTIWVLVFCVMPLSCVMTAFYFWILSAITQSMAHLENRRQAVKLQMYKRLYRLLASSIFAILLMFIIDTIFFTNRSSPSWLPTHWQIRWLLLDGWLNILYLVVFLGIAYLWRPTENNQRLGLDELATDDPDDFRVVNGGGAGQQVALRKVVVVGSDAEDEEGGHDGEDEEEEDVMKWAEENVAVERGSREERRLIEGRDPKMH